MPRLLSRPGGIRFRKLTLKWFREEDISLMTALVEGCSRTLEPFNITRDVHGTYGYSTPVYQPVNSASGQIGGSLG